jgi:sulfopyruvate decarboxylase TPP-binding subunit
MTVYAVPTTKMGSWLNYEDHIITTDEAEAVAMACGEYLATGKTATVAFGENGLLNALDAIITLSQLHEIPIDILLFIRDDEPQHSMVSRKLDQLLELYKIKVRRHVD